MLDMNGFRLALAETGREWTERQDDGKIIFISGNKTVIAQEDGFYISDNGLPACFHVEAQETGWRRVD